MTNNSKVNILLVDDKHENLATLEAVLGELGENLVTARSGIEALKKLMGADFALILLDVKMPESDGFETAALIRKRARWQNTPIIFMTAEYGNVGQMFEGYKLGAIDFIFKPIVPDILRAKVRVLVDLTKTLIQLKERVAQLERQVGTGDGAGVDRTAGR